MSEGAGLVSLCVRFSFELPPLKNAGTEFAEELELFVQPLEMALEREKLDQDILAGGLELGSRVGIAHLRSKAVHRFTCAGPR